MTAKVTKSKNVISGKNAKIYPKGESIQTSYDRMKKEVKKMIPAPARSHKKKVPMVLPETEFSTYHYAKEDTPFPAGKPATILYKKLPDDMILITGFENFLSLDEILDKYGKRVAKAYSDYPHHMTGDTKVVALSGVLIHQSLVIGDLFDKAKFSQIIAHVKKCGGLLHDIIQAVNGPTGTQGSTGAVGSQGITGIQGTQGNVGSVYLSTEESEE